MTTEKHPDRKYRGFALVVLTLIFCTACGAKLVRGESPMVRMTELSHQDNSIALQLSMRNPNGVPLDVLNIDFSLSVNDDELFTYIGPVDTNIVANGTETWSVDIEESKTSRELLDTLQNGDVKSLPYSLKGSITTSDSGNLRFEYEGHIYPLPGRPGHFR
jgi:LEA14-like dessication related protein